MGGRSHFVVRLPACARSTWTGYGGSADEPFQPSASAAKKIQYRLLATSRTSTMQKELREAGDAGFRLVGMTVAKTAMGGSELVSIMRREAG